MQGPSLQTAHETPPRPGRRMTTILARAWYPATMVLAVVGFGLLLEAGAPMALATYAPVFLAGVALLALERATQAGTSLVFGYLGGAPLPFETKPGTSSFILGLRALPLVLAWRYWRWSACSRKGFSGGRRRPTSGPTPHFSRWSRWRCRACCSS